MDELSPRVQEFLREHLIVVLLAVVGVGLLLYGLTVFDTQKNEEVIFESASDSASGDNKTSVKDTILVDVSGAVIKPGVYHLAPESRVQDAILAAGGMHTDADRDYVAKQLNLAAKITDGAKVYIPRSGEVLTQSTTGSGVGNGININSATSKELDSLPGVGAVTTDKIISGRPYSATDDLVTKKIVTKKVFEQIKDKISVY